MSQANIDVKVMDGVFVKLLCLPTWYTACQTGATSKGRVEDRKVAVGMCGKSDARGRNPPVLFLRT